MVGESSDFALLLGAVCSLDKTEKSYTSRGAASEISSHSSRERKHDQRTASAEAGETIYLLL
jgi:hypothetical protein